MKVISIDPAPSKNACVFDGEDFLRMTPDELVEYCVKQDPKPKTLLCWDAPLTGPWEIPAAKANRPIKKYSQRIIEAFFNRNETGFKCPKGISVLGYAGCPHWAVTQASLGLPIVGKYNHTKSNLTFNLATDKSKIDSIERPVVETHPALAIWLWLKGCRSDIDGDVVSWVYKGRDRAQGERLGIEELWCLLTEKWRETKNKAVTTNIKNRDPPEDDDQLDAYVGWVLGTLLAGNHPSVDILGSRNTGAIALPLSSDLEKSFDEFAGTNS